MKRSKRTARGLYADFRNKYGIHICTDHTGKMTGNESISSSAMHNDGCKARAKVPGSICEHCFAMSMENAYSDLTALLENNLKVLSTTIIPVHEWPIVNVNMFRIESFGDVKNTIQVNNYLNFVERNPNTTFAAWTKVPGLYDMVFKKRDKPANLIMIVSSMFINQIADVSRYEWADKVFTVFSADYVLEHPETSIDCGGKKCVECRRCYTHNAAGVAVQYVNELLKKEQRIPAAAENELEKIERKLDVWKMRKDAAAYEIDNFNELHADRVEYSNTMGCKIYRFTDPAAADKARRAAENEYSKACKYIAYWTEKHAAALDYYYKTRRLIAI